MKTRTKKRIFQKLPRKLTLITDHIHAPDRNLRVDRDQDPNRKADQGQDQVQAHQNQGRDLEVDLVHTLAPGLQVNLLKDQKGRNLNRGRIALVV